MCIFMVIMHAYMARIKHFNRIEGPSMIRIISFSPFNSPFYNLLFLFAGAIVRIEILSSIHISVRFGR